MKSHAGILAAAGALALAGMLTGAGTAVAEDLFLALENSSSAAVVEFYTSPSDVNEWEEDVLGVDVLGPGEAVDVTIADGRTQCFYDLRFVFSDNTVFEDHNVDLCETGSYMLSD